MLLTMEADCMKEELYRYFGRSTDAPSKAAFYKQRKKIKNDAFRNLLISSKLHVMALLQIFLGIPMTRILSSSQMESPPEDLTKSISMHSSLYWTKNLRIS